MKKLPHILTALLLIFSSAFAHAEPLKLNWIDLIPEK